MKVGYYIKIDGKWQLEKEWLNKAFNLADECYYYTNGIWWYSSIRAYTQSDENYFRNWKENSPPPEEDLTLIMLRL